MTSPSFLTRPRELLTADGRFESLGVGGAQWRRPLVILSRELCAFTWFDSGRATGSAARAAANLHARTTAPFTNAGTLVHRGPGGFGIWSWDRDWLAPRLVDHFGARAVTVVPESLGQPAGDGWRIVRGSSGYEAQCWIAGALVASAWRRDPFDEASWRSFARVQRDIPVEAPSQPPSAQSLPLSIEPGGGFERLELSGSEAARSSAVAAAIALIIAGGLFSGQALRLRALAKATETQVAAVRATTPNSNPNDVRGRVAAFRRLASRPDVLHALSVALGILKLYDVQPKGFAIDGSTMTLTLPYSAIGQVDRITRELQFSGVVLDARPLADSAAQEVDLKLTLRERAADVSQPG